MAHTTLKEHRKKVVERNKQQFLEMRERIKNGEKSPDTLRQESKRKKHRDYSKNYNNRVIDRKTIKKYNTQYKSYEHYLSSKLWAEIRKRVIGKKKLCEICHKNKFVDVHHKKYRGYGKERYCDLILVCRECHKDIHGLKVAG